MLAVCTHAAGDNEPRGLDFYFIDVEGGAATLIVTPAGESILIDSGNPGERDAARIAAAAKDAGVSAIDYYITTHWHSDHVGGAAPLAEADADPPALRSRDSGPAARRHQQAI